MASKKSLEAAAATSGMFSAAEEQETQEQGKQEKGGAKKNQETKEEAVTFSVRIGAETLKRWRIYSSMNGYGDKGRLTESALNEYMNRHKLNPEQQAKFDALCELQ